MSIWEESSLTAQPSFGCAIVVYNRDLQNSVQSYFSLQVSKGGVPKPLIREATVTTHGLEGEAQRNTCHHGDSFPKLAMSMRYNKLQIKCANTFSHLSSTTKDSLESEGWLVPAPLGTSP